ncbi:hypothetical protein [Chryseobacterium sp. UNC8MFCol]|uniref:hypothetical protein n=1 Tax=Chryseobacterium sp. UNC8MFCol TaxID=1340435 RepID=UPI00048080A2|nr:hypothetical protein [Chryseobacterium sp. UNC8MFCol]
MKLKLMTFLSLSMLLVSCAQDETRDDVMPAEKQIAVNGDKASRIGTTTVNLIKEVYHPSVLNAGQAITVEDQGVKYQLVMQYDNNLVLYQIAGNRTTPVWKSNSYRPEGGSTQLIAQNDGNMVIYNNGIPIWNTNKTVNFFVNDPHMKLQLFSKKDIFGYVGHRIKFVLGGNNQNLNDVFQVDVEDITIRL